jgi:hypothetical protein
MSSCYDFQKWSILTLSAILTVCLVGMINLVYGQIDYGKQLQEQLENSIEKSISNATGIPFDLHKNYTEQENALMGIKLLVFICTNQEKQTGIDPEVLKYRCDMAMKELRDKGLIE